MSSPTIRHSGVHENTQSTQSAARLATGHTPQTADYWAAASHYPPGFGPGEPYYEPAHLRHKPGDNWKIGGKPHDPDDPGPYGTPGWYQDRRTGRHRRGELPDPLPETGPEAPEGFSRTQEPEGPPQTQESGGFSRMQEDAYQAFLRDSEELHRAHYETAEEHRALVRLRWFLRVLLAVLYWRVLPFPQKPTPRQAARRTGGPKRAERDAYRPKRAAGKSAEQAVKRSGTQPEACTTRREERTVADRRPAPGRRPAPSPRAASGPRPVQRRRLNTGVDTDTTGTSRGAGGVGSAPQAFFAAVRAARGQARMPDLPGMTGLNGMTGAAGVVGGEAL